MQGVSVHLAQQQHNLGTGEPENPESDQTDRKRAARPKKHKGSHISGRNVSTRTNKRKHSEILHQQDSKQDSTPVEIELKRPRVPALLKSKSTSSTLQKKIYADLTKSARGGLGVAIYGDFWDAFHSILNAYRSLSSTEIKQVDEKHILSAWAYPNGAADGYLLCTWDNSLNKPAVIPYLWDLAKNLLLCGLKSGKEYFVHLTDFKQEKRRITAWECLNLFLSQYLIEHNCSVSVNSFRTTLLNSLENPSPTTSDINKKLAILHDCYHGNCENIELTGIQLFTDSGWKKLKNLLYMPDRERKKHPEQVIPLVNGIISTALHDFLEIIPDRPDETDTSDMHPELNKPIRRTIATSEFNISSSSNKLHSENTYATLVYPMINAEKYGLAEDDLHKYRFLLSAAMILNQYYFIIMAESPENPSFLNNTLWKEEHKYNSIFPFLLTFKPGISSLPSESNQFVGENIDYEKLLRYFSVTTSRHDEHKHNSKPTKSLLKKETNHQEEKLTRLQNENSKLKNEIKTLKQISIKKDSAIIQLKKEKSLIAQQKHTEESKQRDQILFLQKDNRGMKKELKNMQSFLKEFNNTVNLSIKAREKTAKEIKELKKTINKSNITSQVSNKRVDGSAEQNILKKYMENFCSSLRYECLTDPTENTTASETDPICSSGEKKAQTNIPDDNEQNHSQSPSQVTAQNSVVNITETPPQPGKINNNFPENVFSVPDFDQLPSQLIQELQQICKNSDPSKMECTHFDISELDNIFDTT